MTSLPSCFKPALIMALAISSSTVLFADAGKAAPVRTFLAYNRPDTVPNNPSLNNDINQRLKDIDEALDKINDQLSDKNMKKMQATMEQAINEIDLAAMEARVAAELSKVNWKEIEQAAKEAVNKIDFEKLQREIKAAVQQLDDKSTALKLQEQLNHAMAQSEKALAQVKQMDLARVQEKLGNASTAWQQQQGKMSQQFQESRAAMVASQREMKTQLAKSAESLKRSKETLTRYKDLLAKLESAGLVRSQEDYTIEWKEDKLFINGKQQSRKVTKRFREYFIDGEVTIRNANGHFMITNDSH